MPLDPCGHCEEEVEPGPGVERTPHIDLDMTVSERAYHPECRIRMMVGSIGHLKHLCSCYGGTEEDPPGISKREAAKLAATFFAESMRAVLR